MAGEALGRRTAQVQHQVVAVRPDQGHPAVDLVPPAFGDALAQRRGELRRRRQHGGQLEDIAPYVEDSGEGRWTILEAINENVPAPVIAASLFARFASRDEIKFSAKVAAALREQFGGHAIRALERAKASQDPR